MTATTTISPSRATRGEVHRRGGESAARCYQCGTCSAACQLASGDLAFPRRQMLRAQWGLGDELARDPAVWLCHQCNDCTERCPRDARPGDVLQTARALAVRRLSWPGFLGALVARAEVTWPLLLGLPTLFWILLVAAGKGLGAPQVPPGEAFAFEDFVPHATLYAVFFPTAAFVTLALLIGGLRFWRGLEGAERRTGPFLGSLLPVLIEIATHKRFASCARSRPRRLWHFALLWGFVGAAITSALLIVGIYVLHEAMPLGVWHPFKILGNLSAVLLLCGGLMLLLNRLSRPQQTGASTSFDTFFLAVVVLVIVTGALIEVLRLAGLVEAGCWLYLLHLGAVLCLFLTTPYSKFAHMLYRTLALVHERLLRAAPAARETL